MPSISILEKPKIDSKYYKDDKENEKFPARNYFPDADAND